MGGPNVESYYQTALTANGVGYSYWDLSADPTFPLSMLTAHKKVVWFTGNAFPGPVMPYESQLAAFLDGGGRLFLSGQDILDQSAGTTPFVHNYLHINWDGSEAQNDKATAAVHGVGGNPVTNGIGADSVLECVGTQESMMQTINSTRPGGYVGFVGVPHGVSLDLGQFFYTHVHLHGGPAPVRRYLPELIKLVLDGKINPGKVFDLNLPLDQVAEGYLAMDERRAIKTLLRPNGTR